jgi:hypothetical protein
MESVISRCSNSQRGGSACARADADVRSAACPAAQLIATEGHLEITGAAGSAPVR